MTPIGRAGTTKKNFFFKHLYISDTGTFTDAGTDTRTFTDAGTDMGTFSDAGTDMGTFTGTGSETGTVNFDIFEIKVTGTLTGTLTGIKIHSLGLQMNYCK